MELWIIWMIIGVILVIVEMFTMTFFVSIFGVASILTGIIGIFAPLYIQLLVFILSTVLLLIFLRPFFIKYLNKNTTLSNVNALIGKTLVVSTTIDNQNNKGYVKSGGDYWKARSSDNSIIEEGTLVSVLKMEGVTVTVNREEK